MWVMVGYGRFLTVLRGFLSSFCGFFVKFLWVRKPTCGYLFHKPTHGFASFPTEILMKTHTKHMWVLCHIPCGSNVTTDADMTLSI